MILDAKASLSYRAALHTLCKTLFRNALFLEGLVIGRLRHRPVACPRLTRFKCEAGSTPLKLNGTGSKQPDQIEMQQSVQAVGIDPLCKSANRQPHPNDAD